VFNEGPFSKSLTDQVRELGSGLIADNTDPLVFAYVGGPRGKTAAENRMWPKLGAHVNSMTLAPEVILANECEIPAAGLVVGHKYSIPDRPNPESSKSVTESLEQSRTSMERVLQQFLQSGEPVAFQNQIYRFS
jgi:purine nucleoside phosphorylase